MIINLFKRAKEIGFNNKKSGLAATNVQDAIDEQNNNFEPVLLWENSSPTSNFSEQSINVDYSRFKRILIEVGYSTTTGTSGGVLTFNYLTDSINKVLTLHYITNYPSFAARDALFENGKITFTKGKIGSIDQNMADDNSRCIPLRIYGLNYL